ncbi:MAG: DUF421 domain-containing protein [Candidatus Tokpelaia sp.]|uniref:YetF domain-containing protein n=1 Tax=Candidatus Tokpelaia sp. TaxID=2233777 RepID=UPI00123A9638|nr:YetF domain-containing protein [Candidatus Tokpelaia sp.]KAA6204996.1 MAG: DUF421 domain-containing protein [Candidatus Tokpelaia sp.]KAA6207022.1 MAG: DUF421 domain-containing protein [Candidatus Tokpelaia sp.]KAA6405439.1 hypothetical protein DPQ22_05140 [Candidatus Tokpelaia sp.]
MTAAQFFSDPAAWLKPELMFYFYVLLRLVTGLFIVLAYFYISGRTQLAQINSIDIIGNFIFGGIIGGAIYSDEGSYLHYVGILLIASLILTFINYLSRNSYILRTIAIGHPISIIRDGAFLMTNILNKSNKVDIINVTSQLNAQGLHSDEIYYAQIEPSGVVSAIADKAKLPSTIVVFKGGFYYDELKTIHKTDKDVLADLKQRGLGKISDIYLGEYKNGQFKYITTEGKVYPKLKDKKQSAEKQAKRAFCRKAAAQHRRKNFSCRIAGIEKIKTDS